MNELISAPEAYRTVFKALQNQDLHLAQSCLDHLLTAHPNWAPSYAAQAAIALHHQDFPSVKVAFEKALKLEPDNMEYVCNLLQVLRYLQAVPELKHYCLTLDPETANLTLCKLVIQVLAELKEYTSEYAISWWQRAQTLEPNLEEAEAFFETLQARQPDLLTHYVESLADISAVYETLQDKLAYYFFEVAFYPQAIALWQTLNARQPTPHRLNSIGAAYLHQKMPGQAEAFFHKALHLQADFAPAHYNLLQLYLADKNYQQALQHFPHCLHLPSILPLLDWTATELWKSGNYREVEAYFELCEPYLEQLGWQKHNFYHDWAICAHFNHNLSAMYARFRKARKASPCPLIYDWEEIIRLPIIYENEAHLYQTRKRFEFQLDKFSRKIETLLRQNKPISNFQPEYPFYLAYQGMNDRLILEKIGNLQIKLLHSKKPAIALNYLPGSKGVLKVGFVSYFFYQHSILICYEKLITELAQHPALDVKLFYLGQHQDHCTENLKQNVASFQHLPDAQTAQNRLIEQQLDILIYTDVGMHKDSYFLALQRLAPIQIVFPGHPVTTGSPNIDYFFSNAMIEPEGAQTHYTEKLVLFPKGFGNYHSILQPPAGSRNELGWPENKRIYFCPMTLIKVHPSFDFLLAEILQRDPDAEVWFVENQKDTQMHQLLKQRFQRTIAEVAERIHFMPWMSRERFYQAIQCADVNLDTPYFGAGTTTRMVLGLYQPLVSLQGEFFRSRIPAQCYRRLQLESELLLTSPQAYIEKALQLAQDLSYRQQIQQALKERVHILFNETDKSQHVADFLLKAARHYPQLIGYED